MIFDTLAKAIQHVAPRDEPVEAEILLCLSPSPLLVSRPPGASVPAIELGGTSRLAIPDDPEGQIPFLEDLWNSEEVSRLLETYCPDLLEWRLAAPLTPESRGVSLLTERTGTRIAPSPGHVPLGPAYVCAALEQIRVRFLETLTLRARSRRSFGLWEEPTQAEARGEDVHIVVSVRPKIDDHSTAFVGRIEEILCLTAELLGQSAVSGRLMLRSTGWVSVYCGQRTPWSERDPKQVPAGEKSGSKRKQTWKESVDNLVGGSTVDVGHFSFSAHREARRLLVVKDVREPQDGSVGPAPFNLPNLATIELREVDSEKRERVYLLRSFRPPEADELGLPEELLPEKEDQAVEVQSLWDQRIDGSTPDEIAWNRSIVYAGCHVINAGCHVIRSSPRKAIMLPLDVCCTSHGSQDAAEGGPWFGQVAVLVLEGAGRGDHARSARWRPGQGCVSSCSLGSEVLLLRVKEESERIPAPTIMQDATSTGSIPFSLRVSSHTEPGSELLAVHFGPPDAGCGCGHQGMRAG